MQLPRLESLATTVLQCRICSGVSVKWNVAKRGQKSFIFSPTASEASCSARSGSRSPWNERSATKSLSPQRSECAAVVQGCRNLKITRRTWPHRQLLHQLTSPFSTAFAPASHHRFQRPRGELFSSSEWSVSKVQTMFMPMSVFWRSLLWQSWVCTPKNKTHLHSILGK